MTQTSSMDVQDLKVLEVFPQTRQVPQYFAEFGEKLPQKLKNGVSMFLLHTPDGAEPRTEDVVAEAVAEPLASAEPEKKKRKYKKSDEAEVVAAVAEESPKKKARVKKVDTHYKLFLKATQDGILGKKNTLIEAQKIPSGTIIHLVKGYKYVSTMIYYNNFWYDF